MNKYKNLIALKNNNMYKDNPSDNVIAILDFNKTNFFNKIIKSSKIKFGHLKLGKYNYNDEDFILVNLPKIKNNNQNKIIKDFIEFCNPILIVIITDGISLREDMHYVLKILETNINLILCINNIKNINTKVINNALGIPVIEFEPNIIKKMIYKYSVENKTSRKNTFFSTKIEESINNIQDYITNVFENANYRVLSIELLVSDSITTSISEYLNYNVLNDNNLQNIIINERLKHYNIKEEISNIFKNKATLIYDKCLENNYY